MGLRDRLLAVMDRRPPDFIVGSVDDPYLLRWWLIPRNRFFNLYLHMFLRSDDDRALHDHPWLFNCSVLLDGCYFEHQPGGAEKFRTKGSWYFRWGRSTHRVELLAKRPCATLFITGPVVREWGFHCPKGWVPWRVFTATKNGVSTVGRGCE